MLARRLRLLRKAAGLTLADAAPALDWSVSKLSRIEIAQVGVDVHGVRSMLDLYEAADQWTELVELAREANQRGWYRAYGLGDHSYVGYETEAVQVQEYAAGFVPGLLQVADYAKALFLATPIRRSAAELEREIAVRMIRQRRLTAAENELRLVAVVAEGVLRNPVGGPAVLGAQLEHLLIAAELDNVSLQVLPAGVGAHAALASGFYVLSFGDIGEPDMAYVEHALGAVHLEKEAEVSLARLAFDQLRSLALAPAESLALVERALAES
jgi:hypothetical protein